MSENCENCKANPVDIVRNTQGTPTAKLIAILTAHGITSAAEIAELVGISDRAVRKARSYRTGTQVPRGTTGPELQDRCGTQVPKTELQDRNSGSALACAGITTRATNELPSEVLIAKKVDSPLAPQAEEMPPPAAVAEPIEASTPAALPAPSRQPLQKRGARLDREWTLPAEWMTWARVNCAGASVEQIEDQAAQFRDYWIAKPGAQACKLDWEATWRNWCRKGLSPLGRVRQPQHTGVFGRPKIDLDKLTDWSMTEAAA